LPRCNASAKSMSTPFSATIRIDASNRESMKKFDICMIGAGRIVKSAIIRELTIRGFSVVDLEKHDGPARETSGLNSSVVHSGFHESPRTLKAQLALASNRLLTEYASARSVRLMRTGMLIAIPRGAIRHGLWRETSAL